MHGIIRRFLGEREMVIRIVVLAIGLLLGYGIASTQLRLQQEDFLNSFYPLRADDTTLSLVHPLIAYETPQATGLPEYADLKKKVEALINEKLHGGAIESISVYYRNIETSRWIGINEDTAYYPASLLKVPLMIAYFKAAESDPTILKRRITFEPISGGADFEAPTGLSVGSSYTVQELIEHMIIDSDNGATFTLFSRLDPDLLATVYKRLSITDPGDDSSIYQIPTKTYALFFRTLYNGTYLTPSASQKALELLSQTTYTNGLVAGVPKDTIVAHKFGEHVLEENGKPIGEELHDCGIVYKPNHPYLLCVMTRAKTRESAESVISAISRVVYENESSENLRL